MRTCRSSASSALAGGVTRGGGLQALRGGTGAGNWEKLKSRGRERWKVRGLVMKRRDGRCSSANAVADDPGAVSQVGRGERGVMILTRADDPAGRSSSVTCGRGGGCWTGCRWRWSTRRWTWRRS